MAPPIHEQCRQQTKQEDKKMKKQVQKKTQLTLFIKKKRTVQFTCKQAKRYEADIHPMGRPHVGPMLAFRCADRGLIALRSTSQNVHLDEGKIIMALASTAALMLMKKRKGWLFWYSNQMEELGAALSATGCQRCCVIFMFSLRHKPTN